MNTRFGRPFIRPTFVLLVTLSCSIQGCKQASKTEANSSSQASSTEKSVFLDEIAPIKELTLPLTFYCGAETVTRAEDMGKAIQHLAPNNAYIVGRIPVSSDKVYIIYGLIGDIISPYMYIYSSQGQKLDSLDLHINGCVTDDSGSITNITTISKDYSITMTDTTTYTHYEHELIVDSIFVTKKELKLGSNGLYTTTGEQRHPVE